MCVSLVFLLFQSITFYLFLVPWRHLLRSVSFAVFLFFLSDFIPYLSLALFSSSSSLFFVLIVIHYSSHFFLILAFLFRAFIVSYSFLLILIKSIAYQFGDFFSLTYIVGLSKRQIEEK